MGRGLPRPGGGVSGAGAGVARRDGGDAALFGAGGRRAVRGNPRRPRPDHPPRPDALEPPRLPRLLRELLLGGRDPRRVRGRHPGRQRHALANLARGHRARGARHRLVTRAAGAARSVRGRHPRHRFDQQLHRPARGSRGRRRGFSRARPHGPLRCAATRRVRLESGSLVAREGGDRRRPGTSRPPANRDRRSVRDGRPGLGAAAPHRPRRRRPAHDGLRDHRDDLQQRRRPDGATRWRG